MTTNNHPAHGPVSLDRLHQISEILSKAAAQIDGGNLGYAMADAVKVIDVAIAAFGSEPVEFLPDNLDRALTILGVALPISKEEFNLGAERWMQRLINRVIRLEKELITPAPVVPEWTNEECLEFLSIAFRHAEIKGDLELDDIRLGVKMVNGGRAAMLKAGNSPVTPDGYVLVPIEPTENMIINGFESEPDEFFSKSEEWDAYQEMSGCEQAAHRAKLCWAAMIKAAPQQEVTSARVHPARNK
ncbi:hypothetical protein [Citrobacter braakii]|uniref:hypothetical protein n=1 Tax=Citrobacter braakii TaxID=57706 RepID=UPI001C7CFD2B|nr:hypothetical protein [Citrobacter braakii]